MVWKKLKVRHLVLPLAATRRQPTSLHSYYDFCLIEYRYHYSFISEKRSQIDIVISNLHPYRIIQSFECLNEFN